jgi:hypothetical protein
LVVQASLSLQVVPLRFVHAPGLAAVLHAWQSFVLLLPHATLQQTPSVQKFVPHMPARVHPLAGPSFV